MKIGSATCSWFVWCENYSEWEGFVYCLRFVLFLDRLWNRRHLWVRAHRSRFRDSAPFGTTDHKCLMAGVDCSNVRA